MPEHIPEERPNEDSVEQLLDYHNEQFRNPEWEGLLYRALYCQEKGATLEDMAGLNDGLLRAGIVGASATVFGRVHAMEGDEYDDDPTLANDSPYQCDLFNTFSPEDEGKTKVGLQLFSPTGDKSAVFVDELVHIEFGDDVPSVAEQWVRYKYPELYEMIVESLPEDTSDIEDILLFLKSFIIESGDHELLDKLGPTLFKLLQFDTEPYNVKLKGLVSTTNDEEDIVPEKIKGTMSMAQVDDVVMMPREDGLYMPGLVLSSPLPGYQEEKRDAIVAKANVIRSMKYCRPQEGIGRQATRYAFDGGADTGQWYRGALYGANSEFGDSREEAWKAEFLRQVQELPVVRADRDKEVAGIEDITVDIQRIHTSFQDHIAAYTEFGVLNPESMNSVMEHMSKDMEDIEGLNLGDHIRTTQSGGTILDDEGVQNTFNVTQKIGGTFRGISVSSMPRKNRKSKRGNDFTVAVILDDAYKIAADGSREELSGSNAIVLHEESQFVRIDYVDKRV